MRNLRPLLGLRKEHCVHRTLTALDRLDHPAGPLAPGTASRPPLDPHANGVCWSGDPQREVRAYTNSAFKRRFTSNGLGVYRTARANGRYMSGADRHTRNKIESMEMSIESRKEHHEWRAALLC